MSFLSFTIFVAMGNNLDLQTTIEIGIMFTWVRKCFDKIIGMKDSYVDY